MAIATGVAKQLKFKREATYGTVPVAASSQALRRVTSNLDLSKETYQSNEIRTDYQVADFRHGVRSVAGTINGELSPLTYSDFMAAALRKEFAATTALTGLSLTIAGTPGAYTCTGTGFLAGGLKRGDVFRITLATGLNADVLNKNFFIISVTATVITFAVLNASTITTGSGTVCTISVPGKKVWVPLTGHTNISYSIEHYYSDLVQSEVFSGCKVNQLDIQLPATGMATIGVGIMGQNVTTAAAEYFTTPTAATGTGLLTAVNGVLYVSGVKVANVTGMNITVASNLSNEAIVGSSFKSEVILGRVAVSGQFTAFFDSITMRDLFINETEADINAVFTTDNTATADFLTIVLPRIKTGGATKDDGEKGLIQTIPFTALLNVTGGAALDELATTISIQDSAA